MGNSFISTSEEDDFRKQLNLYYSKVGNAYFDARVFAVENKEEAFNSVLWRVRDAEKNSKSMDAYNCLPHKTLLGKTGE